MHPARLLLPLPLLLLAPLPACGGSDDATGGAPANETGAGSTPCDPFAASPKPIALGTVIAAGKSQSGVVYAVDESANDERVFVAAAGTLVRQRIAGSGESPDFAVFSIDDHEPPFTLQIDFSGGVPVAMGVLEGPLPDGKKTFVIGKDGEQLTMLAAAEVASMPVENLPGARVLEYDARLDDGRELVVVRPADDWTYTDFRLFFGKPPSLAERHVTNVSRGNDTYIEFDLDGAPAQAVFHVAFDADAGFTPGEATLTASGATEPLTQLPTSAPPQGMTYTCFPTAAP